MTAYLLPGVEVSSLTSTVAVAVLLALFNTFLKPLLVILTLPVTILTLGLFTLVINALLVLLVSSLVPGFEVSGFVWALIFGLVLSIVNTLLNSLVRN